MVSQRGSGRMHGVQGTDGGEEFLVVRKGDSTSHLKIETYIPYIMEMVF